MARSIFDPVIFFCRPLTWDRAQIQDLAIHPGLATNLAYQIWNTMSGHNNFL